MPLMQPGEYWGTFDKAECAELNNDKQTPLMYVTFQITHCAANGQWLELDSNVKADCDVRLFMSDKAWPYTEKKLQGMGFNGNFDEPDFDPEWKKQGCKLICSHRQGTGQDQTTYEDWDFADWGGGERKPLSDDKTRLLTARWKTANAAAQTPAGEPVPASAPAPIGAGPGTEEIPF